MYSILDVICNDWQLHEKLVSHNRAMRYLVLCVCVYIYTYVDEKRTVQLRKQIHMNAWALAACEEIMHFLQTKEMKFDTLRR